MSKMLNNNEVSEELFENKIWLNVSEASSYSGISKSMLYKHKDYCIPCHSTTGRKNGGLRFNKDDLDKWWDERKIS